MLQTLREFLRLYPEKVTPIIRYGAVIAWAGTIWWLSSRSVAGLPSGVIWSHLWNAGHVVLFGVLAALILLSTRRCTPALAALAVGVSVVYGVTDELHQGMADNGRCMDAWDLISDSMGACTAASTVFWLRTGSRAALLQLPFWIVLAAGSVHMAASH